MPIRKAVLEYKPACGGDPNKQSDKKEGRGASEVDPAGNNSAGMGAGALFGQNTSEKDMLYELHHLFKQL